MGWWRVSADTLATSRFVVSPLAETTASLITLQRGTAAHPGERRWLDAHLPRLPGTSGRRPCHGPGHQRRPQAALDR